MGRRMGEIRPRRTDPRFEQQVIFSEGELVDEATRLAYTVATNQVHVGIVQWISSEGTRALVFRLPGVVENINVVRVTE